MKTPQLSSLISQPSFYNKICGSFHFASPTISTSKQRRCYVKQALRVAIVTSDQLALIGLRTLINQQSHLTVSCEAADYHQLLTLCEWSMPSVVLIALYSVPNADFLESLQAVHQRYSALPLLILAPAYALACVQQLIHRGVAGYLLTTEPPETIIKAIQTVTTGGVWFTANLLQTVAWPAEAGLTHAERDPLSQLTGREIQIIALLVRGWKNRQISHNLGIAERTVCFHTVHSLRNLAKRRIH